MRKIIKIALCAVALFANLAAWAQNNESGEKFAFKPYANIGLGDAVSIESTLPGVKKSSSSNDFGVDFGWTFWHRQKHSLEANIGIAYSISSVKLGMENFDYSYSASADADMDGDSYIRHYELSYLNHKTTLGRVTLPLYLSYAYRCNKWMKIHADLGVSLGFKISSELSNLSGEGYSYGVYPQYDNLKIEDSYINDFGPKTYLKSMCMEPTANSLSCSILTGIGVEFKIYGPFAADLSFRYNKGLTNLYDSTFEQIGAFSSVDAPVTYTVKDGQRIIPLTDYTTASKLSNMSLKISLLYRF